MRQLSAAKTIVNFMGFIIIVYVWHAFLDCTIWFSAVVVDVVECRRRRHTKSNDTTGQTVVSSFSIQSTLCCVCVELCECECMALAGRCASIISSAQKS